MLEVPENKTEIDAAIAAAGGDLMKLMQSAVPIVVKLLGPQMEALGFPPNQMGVMGFIGQLNGFSSNAEIAAGKAKVMAVMMPKA